MSIPAARPCKAPILDRHRHRVVEGFRVPDDRPPTPNELDWLEMLRAIAGDRDPPPTLSAVQALRQALMDG